MFSLFKRKPKSIPHWDLMESYSKRDYYFYRLMPWGWMNADHIFVTDLHSPRMITMNPWPQVVYLQADGSKTIQEFVYWLVDQYRGNVPKTLVKEMIDLMETMSTQDPLIELVDYKKILKPNLVNPMTKNE